MLGFPLNLFKKKLKDVKSNLETALNLGLITEEEFLRLVVKRAEEELEEHLKNKIKIKIKK